LQGREVWEQRLTEAGKGLVSSRLKAHLPNRLADALAREAGVEERRVSELRKAERLHLLQLVTEYELRYTGHQGYKKAEVGRCAQPPYPYPISPNVCPSAAAQFEGRFRLRAEQSSEFVVGSVVGHSPPHVVVTACCALLDNFEK